MIIELPYKQLQFETIPIGDPRVHRPDREPATTLTLQIQLSPPQITLLDPTNPVPITATEQIGVLNKPVHPWVPLLLD